MIVLLYGFFLFLVFQLVSYPLFSGGGGFFFTFRSMVLYTYICYNNDLVCLFFSSSPIGHIFFHILYIYIYIYNLCIVDPIRGFACQAHTFLLSFVVLLIFLFLILFVCTSSLSFLRGIFFGIDRVDARVETRH